MAKITGKCDPGVRDGVRTKSCTNTTVRISPTFGGAASSTSVETVGVHDRSPLVKGDAFHPLPYRVFAGVHDIKYHDMTLEEPSNNLWKYRQDGYSNPFSMSLYWGTTTAGGLRVPNVGMTLQNMAITEALNNLQNQEMNLLVSIAEARETIDLIATTVSRIVRSYHYARKGKWSQAGNIISGWRKNRPARPIRGWLSYHYGVLPLLGDIQGAFALVHQGLRDQPVVQGRRYVSQPYALPPKPFSAKDWKMRGTCEVGAEACFRARIDSPIIDLMQQMGFYNPFLVAWELVPFSFIVDWLIPVGNALQALTANLNLTFHDGYLNTKVVTDFTWEGYSSSRRYIYGTKPSGNIKNVCQHRKVYTSLPLPRLYLKSPFSTTHVVTALALLGAMKASR